ncbi:hypothetical protein M902_2840 [Bacteriovorax sp. BAL6_X]|nr:hypothetical protein M902_2840 [Bacteriovorax sp. BAL6_X]
MLSHNKIMTKKSRFLKAYCFKSTKNQGINKYIYFEGVI